MVEKRIRCEVAGVGVSGLYKCALAKSGPPGKFAELHFISLSLILTNLKSQMSYRTMGEYFQFGLSVYSTSSPNKY